MDHAEIRERLQDALLGPGKVSALDLDELDGFRAVREHLAGCPACRAEAEALRRTAALLALAAPDELRAPPEARERILAAVAGTGVPRRDAPGRVSPLAASGRSRPRWLIPAGMRSGRGLVLELATAAAVLLIGGALLGLAMFGQRNASEQEARELAHVTAEAEQLLQQADTIRVTLWTPVGAKGGTLLYDRQAHEIVVISTALEASDGVRYRCYLERGQQRTPVGWMRYSNEVSYWAGPLDEPRDAGLPGDRFLVILEGQQEPALAGSFTGI